MRSVSWVNNGVTKLPRNCPVITNITSPLKLQKERVMKSNAIHLHTSQLSGKGGVRELNIVERNSYINVILSFFFFF